MKRLEVVDACKDGNVNLVRKLLKTANIDVNKGDVTRNPLKNGWTPFKIACQKGHIEIVKLLMQDKRVDINNESGNGWTPLQEACFGGHVEIVKLLLEDKRIVINNEKADNALNAALLKGNVKIIKLLLEDGRIDVNNADIHGWTPFCKACSEGNIEIVRLLIKHKNIDVNKPILSGETAFNIACQNGYIEIVKLLMSDNLVDLGRKQNPSDTNINNKPKICFLPPKDQKKFFDKITAKEVSKKQLVEMLHFFSANSIKDNNSTSLSIVKALVKVINQVNSPSSSVSEDHLINNPISESQLSQYQNDLIDLMGLSQDDTTYHAEESFT
jgi:ankyrin repeat protein